MYSEEINRRDDRDERDHRDGFRDAYDRRDEGRFRRDDRRDSRRDGYSSYDDYTTDEIQSEVDRLRYELNTLKRTIDERRADSQEIKSAIVHSEAVYSQQLAEIGKLLEDLGNILNGVQVGIDTKLKNIPSKVSEEIEDAMIPVANKCEIIDERIKAIQSGKTTPGGGVVDPLPEDAPQFVKDYYDYYKTPRGYHARSGNSNDGWHTFGCQAYANTRFLYYINEIRSAVLIVHGEKAHSRYFGENAYEYMMTGKAEGYDAVRKPNPVPENKELLIIPGASHCDLYDGGKDKVIPWGKLASFFNENMK